MARDGFVGVGGGAEDIEGRRPPGDGAGPQGPPGPEGSAGGKGERYMVVRFTVSRMMYWTSISSLQMP